jgi:hypothetical protein
MRCLTTIGGRKLGHLRPDRMEYILVSIYRVGVNLLERVKQVWVSKWVCVYIYIYIYICVYMHICEYIYKGWG